MLTRIQRNRNSHSLLVGMQNGTAFWKTVWWFLTKLNILLPYSTAVVLLGIYPKELKLTITQKPTHRCLYIAALFTTAKNLEATKISFNRWVDKLCYIQTMEYYSVLKRNALSSHKKTWGNFNAYYEVKGANLKSLHTMWLQLNDILKKAKLWRR